MEKRFSDWSGRCKASKQTLKISSSEAIFGHNRTPSFCLNKYISCFKMVGFYFIRSHYLTHINNLINMGV
jgi:hypothetical protein